MIFVYASLYTTLSGFPQRVELLAIPVATLFTVTQLRASMPGAPSGFGTQSSPPCNGGLSHALGLHHR